MLLALKLLEGEVVPRLEPRPLPPLPPAPRPPDPEVRLDPQVAAALPLVIMSST